MMWMIMIKLHDNYVAGYIIIIMLKATGSFAPRIPRAQNCPVCDNVRVFGQNKNGSNKHRHKCSGCMYIYVDILTHTHHQMDSLNSPMRFPNAYKRDTNAMHSGNQTE